VEVIVCENQPFSLADSKNWQDFFHYCNPNAKMPTGATVGNQISSMYECELERMKTILQVNSKLIKILNIQFHSTQFRKLLVKSQSSWIAGHPRISILSLESWQNG